MSSALEICNMALIRAGHDVLEDTDNDPPNIDDDNGQDQAAVLCNLMYGPKRDGLLRMFNWAFAKRQIYLDYEDQVKTVTGATQANPVVITCPAHGFPAYRHAYFTDVGGMTDLNDKTYRINPVDTNTFTLEGIDGTGFGAFTSGGSVRLRPKFKFEYEFTLPDDFLRDYRLNNSSIAAYEIEGSHQLITDLDEIELEYIGQVTDATKFDAAFVLALAEFLAIPLAQKLADSKTLVAEIRKDFKTQYLEAMRQGAIMGKPKDGTRKADRALTALQRAGRP